MRPGRVGTNYGASDDLSCYKILPKGVHPRVWIIIRATDLSHFCCLKYLNKQRKLKSPHHLYFRPHLLLRLVIAIMCSKWRDIYFGHVQVVRFSIRLGQLNLLCLQFVQNAPPHEGVITGGLNFLLLLGLLHTIFNVDHAGVWIKLLQNTRR
jgi:hypothetical protein